jgi:carbamoyl-phosphate synthase large subunit
LREQKEFPLTLIAADINPLASGLYLADKHYLVPKATDEQFIPTILQICTQEGVKIIIPTFSYELPVFAKNKEIFEKRGIKMAISSYETFVITENKLETYKYFAKWGIPFPKIYNKDDIERKQVNFPVVVKPIQASGSKGVQIVNRWEELLLYQDRLNEFIVQELAEGDEYTIDGVSDLSGRMIAACPRIRLEVKGGLAIKSITVNEPRLLELTRKIVEGFHIVGPFNVQCFKKGEKLNFIEVNSRFPSGGLPLTVKAGLNIPLIIIKLLLGYNIEAPRLEWGLVMTRYWDAIILRKTGDGYEKVD